MHSQASVGLVVTRVVIEFKHVGVRDFEPENIAARNRTLVPVGIRTPLTLGSETFLEMTRTALDQIGDNLRNLVQTNHGDRVMLFDFGANLRPLLVEWTSKEDFDSEAMVRINTAITKWMPYITPVGFDSTPQPRNRTLLPTVRILLLWTVPALKSETQTLEVTLAVA